MNGNTAHIISLRKMPQERLRIFEESSVQQFGNLPA
jgi:hypothetical protein